MTKTPEQLIAATKDIRMSPAEYDTMRQTLQAFTVSYVPRSLAASFMRHAVSYSALAVLLFAGGATALAERAMPGDFFYPVKLAVNDRIEVAVAGNEDARLDVELEQMERDIDGEEAVADIELGIESQNNLQVDTQISGDLDTDEVLDDELLDISDELDALLEDGPPEE